MPGPFEPGTINGMKIKNRFVRSATYEAMAGKDGTSSERVANVMARLAGEEVGLVITGHAYVTRQGQAGPTQLGIYSDEMIDGLKQAVSAVHENGGVIAAQLGHAGVRGIGKGEFAPAGPSNVSAGGVNASAMSVEEIEQTMSAFGAAARRAVQAGFDAVQVHSAHGYLLSQFLSPHYNQRTDAYGGTLENRSRLLLDVCKTVRQEVGNDFPLLVKINSEDFLPNGIPMPEVIEVCAMLEKIGVDAVEVSGGTFESGKNIPSRPGTARSEDREVYYKEAAARFKEQVGIPLILVGGFLSYHIAENAVASGLADYVALSRPLIREPGLVRRWSKGDRAKAACISCNKCFRTLASAEGLYCAAEKEEKG